MSNQGVIVAPNQLMGSTSAKDVINKCIWFALTKLRNVSHAQIQSLSSKTFNNNINPVILISHHALHSTTFRIVNRSLSHG